MISTWFSYAAPAPTSSGSATYILPSLPFVALDPNNANTDVMSQIPQMAPTGNRNVAAVLNAAGLLPQARYLVYFSIDRDWWESVDMADALHPQTLLTWAMNDGDLPVPFGGPLRLRVPRQLGYKSVKFITRLTATDSLRGFGKGLGSASPEGGYSWYAGI